MTPRSLFPKIPYTRQKARLGMVTSEHPPFTRYELARIQKMLLARLDEAHCPRCGTAFSAVARRPHGSADREVWVVSCAPCERGAVIPVHRDPEPSADLFRSLPHSGRRSGGRSGWWVARTLGVAAVYLGLFQAVVSSRGVAVERAEAMFIPETLYVALQTPATSRPPSMVAPVMPSPPSAEEIPSIPRPNLPVLSRPAGARANPVALPGPSITPHALVTRFGVEPVAVAVTGPVGPYGYDTVDEPPVLVRAGALRYPPALRGRRVDGAVVVEFVVDSTGLAEQESVRVISSDHPGFDDAAIDAVLASVYHPGRVRGRPVRVLVTLTVHFEVVGRH